MICPSCRNELPESARFCPSCGAAVPSDAAAPAADAAGAQPEGASAQQAQPYAAAQPADAAGGAQQQGHQPYAGASQQPSGAQVPPSDPYAQHRQQPGGQYGQPWGQQPYGAPQQPYGSAPRQPQQTVYAEGCLSAAVADIKASDGWFGKTALLGLVNCVPILNWTVDGYMLNWSREVPFGGRTKLPGGIVSGKNFEIGFYAFLISLIVGFVSIVVGGVLGWVPLIGWLASIALGFLLGMVQLLSLLRISMTQQLGEGFKLGAIFGVIGRNWTGLLCAAVVPSILGAVASGILWTIVALICLPAIIGVVAAAVAVPSSYEMMAALISGIAGMGIVGVVVLIVGWVLTCEISAFANMVSYRAVAHWIGRHAPEWAQQPYGGSSWNGAGGQQGPGAPLR